jgi:multidrug efflux pump subunit AcrB
MSLTDFAFNNKRIVYFLILILSLGGIVSFHFISKLEDPEIKVKKAVVATYYPGANPNQVELEVTKVLEDEIKTMGQLEKVTSRSLANYSEIQISLETTVKDAEVEQMWDILRRKVERAKLSLPAQAYTPVVIDDFGDIYGIFYAMTADGYSYDEMQDFAERIKRDLLTVEGVRRVQLNGKQDYAVYVEMHPAKMANLGVLPAEILLTVQAQDKVVYAGYFENQDSRIRLEVANSFESLEDIENLVIKGHEQDMLLLKDIASVEKRIKTPISKKMLYNDKESIGISISMEAGDNIVELGKRVEEQLAITKQELPIGIDFHKVFYQPEKVNTAIWQFMSNLIQSILIVIIVLLFTMGFKSGILIGKGLIYTILSSFVVLFILGGTLQRVSLASIIVAMGMLVDKLLSL